MRYVAGRTIAVVTLAAASLCPAADGQTLDDVLLKAESYAAEYADAFERVVAEEHVSQEVRRPRWNPRRPGEPERYTIERTRVLDSEILLASDDGLGWVVFRAVQRVDGSIIKDRRSFADVLAAEPAAARAEAAALTRAAVFHNLARIGANVTVPTLPVFFLHPRVRHRFRFEHGGAALVDAARTWVVRYEEIATPTLLHGRRTGDMKARGTLWIDPDSGRVHRTELVLVAEEAADFRTEQTVTYRPEPGFDVWMPASSRELYHDPGDPWASYTLVRTSYGPWRRIDREAVHTVVRPTIAGEPAAAASAPEIVARAAAYVAAYVRTISAVVAEEQYRQVVTRADAERERLMRSDVLLVPVSAREWFGYRDVYEVEGRQVRGREERLRKLFLGKRIDPRRVADESARYNIGEVRRNINVPMTALLFLHPANLARSRFTEQPDAAAAAQGLVVVAFEEQARPTLVSSLGRDFPASGRFWIERESGRVVRTELTLGNELSLVRAVVGVTYAEEPGLKLWVPREMRENYDTPAVRYPEQIECTAVYSKFRRFDVQTIEHIEVPKPPVAPATAGRPRPPKG